MNDKLIKYSMQLYMLSILHKKHMIKELEFLKIKELIDKKYKEFKV